jgi:hypothetical protein
VGPPTHHTVRFAERTACQGCRTTGLKLGMACVSEMRVSARGWAGCAMLAPPRAFIRAPVHRTPRGVPTQASKDNGKEAWACATSLGVRQGKAFAAAHHPLGHKHVDVVKIVDSAVTSLADLVPGSVPRPAAKTGVAVVGGLLLFTLVQKVGTRQHAAECATFAFVATMTMRCSTRR